MTNQSHAQTRVQAALVKEHLKEYEEEMEKIMIAGSEDGCRSLPLYGPGRNLI